MNLVTKGTGTFVLQGKKYNMKKGDIFFVFPAVSYEIISIDNLEYMYVSFIGLGAVEILDRFKISKQMPYYEGFEDVLGFWEEALDLTVSVNSDIISESVVLYTISKMGKAMQIDAKKYEKDNIVLKVKKYVDDNFYDSALSLDEISRKYSYNKKYIGNAFKKYVKVGFKQYLNTIRIQQACTLIDEGMTSVKDISNMCGFSDQMYFSKVFKNIAEKLQAKG